MNRLARALTLRSATSSCCRSHSPWDCRIQGGLFIPAGSREVGELAWVGGGEGVGDKEQMRSSLVPSPSHFHDSLCLTLYEMKLWNLWNLSLKWGNNKTVRGVVRVNTAVKLLTCYWRQHGRWWPQDKAEKAWVQTPALPLTVNIIAVWYWRRHSTSPYLRRPTSSGLCKGYIS